ncbi:Elongation of very long chain fatty acids protein AAEL008004 [Eumeta japonica]|uniref:Elongation of very long chain fatty acids protein n=1 Tax=Eumeta variegata TaxID=151549 RepID=A0A4C1ZA45_EUMVA|nr:Elongation of very long chain fatty acids protein AAEL008004 [Eumeta japonica]
MIGTWAFLKYSPTDNTTFIGLINSCVHILMYTYYGLAACGPTVAKYLFWKRYMTKIQLVQFIALLIHYMASLKVSECPPSKAVYCFFAFNITFFFFLFTNFYRKNYKKEKLNICFSLEKQS